MNYQLQVVKANVLTKASFNLTLNEKRLLLACIAQIKDPRDFVSENEEFFITAHYFSTLFPSVERNNVYGCLVESSKLLLSQTLFIEKPNTKNLKISRRGFNWLSHADYYDGEGKVGIKFNVNVLPYLSQLKEGCFTQYAIEQVSKLKSVYAIRLYELLVSEAFKKQDFVISIIDLKDMLGLIEEYPKVFEFKRCVIDPSIKSITKNTNCNVTYTQLKTGREVTHLVFKYSISGEILTKKPLKITNEYVEKNARPGESFAEARTRLSKLKEGLK